LMAQLYRRTMVGLAAKTAERLLNAGMLSAAELATLQNVLQAARHPDAVRVALYGERLAPLFTDFGAATKDARNPDSLVTLIVSHFFQGEAAKAYLAYATRVVDAADEPYAARIAMADAIEAELDFDGIGVILNLNEVIASIVLPAVLTGQFAFEREAATVSATVTAIAVMRYRADRGGLPDGLDALVPAYLEQVPRYTFDGQPLRSVRNEYRFRVYSIGPDEHDDGGQRPEGRREQPGDLVIEVRLAGSADDDD